jgi:quercetin dioxygenase-like cupin family protein
MQPFRRLAPFLLAGLLAGCAGQAAPPAKPVTVTELASATTTASGQPIRLPSGEIRVVLSDYRIAPAAKLPVHKHPYPRYAVVQSGTLAVTNQATGQTTTYRPGDLVVEAVDQWHSAVNPGTDEVHLLVLDEIPGSGSNTILQEQGSQE